MTDKQTEALKLAREWIGESPERRTLSAGKMVALLTEALAEQPAQQPAQQPICGLDVYLDPNDGLKPKLFPKKPAQPSKPLTDEQIDLFINGRGDEGDDDYVEPTGDGFGLTDADLVRLVRRVEAAHGITGEQK